MRNNEDILSSENFLTDAIIPEGNNSLDTGFETLSQGEVSSWNMAISDVIPRASWISGLQFWGWNVVGSSPNFDLFFTMLGSGFTLVETLESSVVSLVQSPALDDWEVVARHFICGVVIGLDGSCEDGGEDNIELESVLEQSLSCFSCLFNSFRG